MNALLVISFLALARTQKVGSYQKEVHPNLWWKSCTATGGCKTVNGQITMDANMRWLHEAAGFQNCYDGNTWNERVCSSNAECTNACALEGADYARTYGVATIEDRITLKFKTFLDFSQNIGSRLFLMESQNKYQMFTLMDNELAFDVDLSTVECGINAALRFVGMEEDGGVARYSTNKAGAEYGTGYCDASCPRSLKFVAGKANMEGWIPSETDSVSGEGNYGACCSEIGVWNSNAHSFELSSRSCYRNHEYQVCQGREECSAYSRYERGPPLCDPTGCSFNPYRMGSTDFYGKGKTVDTTRNFTVVTRFQETGVAQFFIQDGEKIDIPPPTWEGLSDRSGLSPGLCDNMFSLFDERSFFGEVGGYSKHLEALRRPMALTMSINTDHWAWNAWIDSVYPPEKEGLPGVKRGECIIEDDEPKVVENRWPTAKVVWSNIRFGPVGTTVKV